MDITLNISSNVNYQKTRAKVVPQKNNNKRSSDNGFSFEFTKNNKVKAIVARRRAKRGSSASKSEQKELKKTATVKKSVPPPPPRNYVLRPPDSSDDEYKNSNEIETNLSLNVVQGEYTPVSNEKKKKLSRDDRFQLKREKRQNFDKVLSTEEINEGIKKFSKVPKRSFHKNFVTQEELFKDNPEAKILGQRLVKPLTEKVFTGDSINTLDLHPHCVKNLADILKITELTQVQQKTIPEALKGKDILVRSQTGSGKTLAYALPIVQKLQEIRPKLTRDCGIQAVIIVPTRELAIQTYELFLKLVKPFTWIVPGLLSGGEKRKAEKARLRKGIIVLVGTPGRLVDHLLHTESLRLDKVKWLILDEADRLLELGYERDVKKVVDGINEHKAGRFQIDGEAQSDPTTSPESASSWQRLLLSATLTPAVQKLAGLALIDPLFIDTSDENVKPSCDNDDSFETEVQQAINDGNLVIPATIQLSYILVPPKLRLVTLSGLLAKKCTKKNNKALVFMSTTEMVNYHHDLLNESLTQKVLDDEEEANESEQEDDEPLLMGLRFFKLHGSMTQQERSGVFKSFREAKTGVLLATDVACRGIDVPEVDLIVQYSAPQTVADFVHRVGRTARAGRSGTAILFLGPNESDFIRILEDKRIRISQESLDTYLTALNSADSVAHTPQEAAANLQHKFENLLKEDREMHDRACRAFVSWVKFYSTFPKELRHIFNARNAHMGHYAKSFALRDSPRSFSRNHSAPKTVAPTNRLTYTERDPEKIKEEKQARKRALHLGTSTGSTKPRKFLPNSITLTTSEFDSGLPAIKKKKKK